MTALAEGEAVDVTSGQSAKLSGGSLQVSGTGAHEPVASVAPQTPMVVAADDASGSASETSSDKIERKSAASNAGGNSANASANSNAGGNSANASANSNAGGNSANASSKSNAGGNGNGPEIPAATATAAATR